MNKKILILVLAITVLATALRFYKITLNPPSLNGDEIGFGYSAYSILKTGRDESGKFLPLVIESVGDYKNPVPAYLMVLSMKVLGMTEFAVRFPNALFASITIPIYFFFLKYLLKRPKYALIGTFLLGISSWHIYYSRFAYEGATASLFILLGVWAFMKLLDGKKRWGVVSAFFLVLTMYTSFAPRLFIPVFLFFVGLIRFKKLKKNMGLFVPFIIVCLILGVPLAYVSIFQGAATRLKMVFIANDIDFVRNVAFRYFENLADLPYLLFFWAKRYLNYMQPDFLFVNGMNTMLSPSSFGLGILYLFEAPWLILGAIKFRSIKMPHKDVLLAWLLTGLIPDSLTNNLPHTGRILQIAPVIYLFLALGFWKFFEWIRSRKLLIVKAGVAIGFSLFLVLNLIHAFLVFAVHFPWEKSESFDEGWKEVAEYVVKNQDKYRKIVIDPRRGVESRDMISNPYLYILFYSQYDPFTYQMEPKIHGTEEDPYFSFDKYVFKYIDFHSDPESGVLFIGSPWSFPGEGLRRGELLDQVNLTNGSPAFYMVVPRDR